MMNTGLRFMLFLALVSGLAGCASPTLLPTLSPQPTASITPSGEPVLALTNGLLIDGTGADPVPDAVLLIQKDRILAAGSKDQVAIPAGAQVIDLNGAAILPGFINAHVHFAYDEERLKTWAWNGVTTVRDEGIISSEPLADLLILRDRSKETPTLTRLISAGYMTTVPGGYGQYYVNSPEEARKKVLEELDAGVDLIKISQEDGYAGQHDLPKLTGEEMAAIIQAAHERGTLVSGHSTTAQYMTILTEAGVDDVAHIAWDAVPAKTFALMVQKNIYMTPTFTVFRNYGAPISGCVSNLAAFVKAGGKVALGNDFGGGPGDFEEGIPMYELERMAEAGMTPMQIIVASTLNAAHVSNAENELGSLSPGKFADVLVVDGNPLEDLQALTRVRMVIHYGVIIRDEGK